MFFGFTSLRKLSIALSFVLVAALLPARSLAQNYEREISGSGKSLLTIRNLNGRVTVISSDEQKDKMKFQATSPGATVEPGDIHSSASEILVRERRPQDRIDLTVHLPARARVKIESESGMVDVIGD